MTIVKCAACEVPLRGPGKSLGCEHCSAEMCSGTCERRHKLIAHNELEVDSVPARQSVIVGQHIVFIRLDYDHDTPNPCTDWDGVGQVRSFSTKHANRIDVGAAMAILENDPDVILLSYFEHGQSLWMVKDLPTPPGVEFQWDGVKVAGIWVPDDVLRDQVKEIPKGSEARRLAMLKFAEQACKTYTEWANGEVYWYSVIAYALRTEPFGEVYDQPSDYRLSTPIYEDSCGGFYGWDYFLGEVKTSVQSAIEAVAKAALPFDEQCDCILCAVCGGKTICAKCKMCTRCHQHKPGCAGCSAKENL